MPLPVPRRRTALLLVLLGIALGAALDAPRLLEGPVRRRLVRAAAERGYALRVARITFGLPPRVDLHDVVLSGRGVRAEAGVVAFRLRPALSRRRALRGFSFDRVAVALPGAVEVDLLGGSWEVLLAEGGRLRLAETEGPGRVGLSRDVDGVAFELLDLDLSRLARLRFRGAEPVRPGIVSGAVALRRSAAAELSGEVVLEARGARLASLDPEAAPFGAPLDLSLAGSGTLSLGTGRASLACLRLATQAAVLEAEGEAALSEDDLWAEATVRMARVSIGNLLATSGISLDGGGDLGSVALDVSGSGHLKDPSSIHVEQRLAFTPPAQPPKELLALRGPFVKTLDSPQGPHVADLRPGAPGFLPLEEVPPLFLRTLLISEDAGFWGHPGIDLQEIPVAFATNWNRRERAFGASTITQQLAKNLFLSRKKSYARKLQELALTLLLESTLGKRRILEIYLNVIEWGPGTYGLRDAACRTFGKEPAELTPREGAFLVALIPAPVKYQTSFLKGTETPRFAALVNTLLAKLRSVDVLAEEEYEAARAERLRFAGSAPAPEVGDVAAGGEEGQGSEEGAAPPETEPAVTPAAGAAP